MNVSQIPPSIRKALIREISARYRKQWNATEAHLKACQELATMIEHEPLLQKVKLAQEAISAAQDEVLEVLLELGKKEPTP